MMYDFSELTREQAAENIRQVLDAFSGTKQQHALLDASLALLVGGEVAAPSNGSAPASVLG